MTVRPSVSGWGAHSQSPASSEGDFPQRGHERLSSCAQASQKAPRGKAPSSPRGDPEGATCQMLQPGSCPFLPPGGHREQQLTQEGKRSSICGRGVGGHPRIPGGSFPRPAATVLSLAAPLPRLTYRQGRWTGYCAGWARGPPRRCPGPPGCWQRRGCWRSPGRCWSRSGRSGAAGP